MVWVFSGNKMTHRTDWTNRSRKLPGRRLIDAARVKEDCFAAALLLALHCQPGTRVSTTSRVDCLAAPAALRQRQCALA